MRVMYAVAVLPRLVSVAEVREALRGPDCPVTRPPTASAEDGKNRRETFPHSETKSN